MAGPRKRYNQPQAADAGPAAVSQKRGRPFGSKRGRGLRRPGQTRMLDSESEAASSSDVDSDATQRMEMTESDTEF